MKVYLRGQLPLLTGISVASCGCILRCCGPTRPWTLWWKSSLRIRPRPWRAWRSLRTWAWAWWWSPWIWAWAWAWAWAWSLWSSLNFCFCCRVRLYISNKEKFYNKACLAHQYIYWHILTLRLGTIQWVNTEQYKT